MNESLTREKLEALIASMPLPETWASSRLFPDDKAFRAKAPDEVITIAGPGFWAAARARGLFDTAFPPRVLELDPCESDSEEVAAWRAGERKRILTTVGAVLSAHAQLSDLLRQPHHPRGPAQPPAAG